VHCIKTNFIKILHVLKDALGDGIPVDGNLKRPGPKPRFTDLEVIALSLTAECLGIDSELYLFHKIESDYKNFFRNMISRRQYNDRRKSLLNWQEELRKKLAYKLNAINNVFAIDSMPLEICKLAREQRNKMGKEHEWSSPDKGYCASQGKYFYGYKIHSVCSPVGVIESFDLSKASIHDVKYLKDVATTFSNCIITGDRGYINRSLHEQLLENKNIRIEVPYRHNQKEKKKIDYAYKRIRKRIETVFSQLCDQFMIQRNYAKSFNGFRTRILAKISGMTILQYINKFILDRPVGQVKYALK